MRRFREILVLAPTGPDTPRVVGRAAELAQRNRARLTLFDVVPTLRRRNRIEHGGATIDLQQLLLDSRRRELEELASQVMTADTRVAVEAGVPFVSVIERVAQYEHDLVITPPDDAGSGRGLRGASTTLHLLRKCPVPVWVDDPRTWGRHDVVVAVGPFPDDGEIGTLNRTLTELGTSLAKIQGGDVHLVHAWRLEGEDLMRRGRVRLASSDVDALVEEERASAEKAFRRLVDELEVADEHPHVHLRHGRPADAVAAVVDSVQPGVVVMGTLARAGLRGLIIGNTAERVIGDLAASIIAVKPPGFISPVGTP